MKATLAIRNIAELATPEGHGPRAGAAMSGLRVIKDAAVLVDVEKVAWVGPEADMPRLSGPAPEELDAGGRAVVPGFVDSHTHFVFGGFRDQEFLWRAEGLPYTCQNHRSPSSGPARPSCWR